MHGRKRAEYKALQRDPKVVAGLSAKAQKWHALSAEVATRRRQLQEWAQQQQQSSSDADLEKHQKDVATSLALTEKMLLVNPDPLYLYNFRRELWSYYSSFETNSSATSETTTTTTTDKEANNTETTNNCLETELRVTAAALQNNPKAYGAWFHRKWVILLLFQQSATSTRLQATITITTPDLDTSILQNELDLTRQFLQRDERNFHCWNYRRFVVSCLLNQHGPATTAPPVIGVDTNNNNNNNDEWWASPQVGQRQTAATTSGSHNDTETTTLTTGTTTTSLSPNHLNSVLQTEFDFTTTKIQDNFSNFSAFHYRSKLLPWKVAAAVAAASMTANDGNDNNTTTTKQDILATEWELWQNAVFTEPDDQTAWWYGRFLLDFMLADDDSKTDDPIITGLLEQQIEQIRELAQEMPDSKWVCLGLHMLLEAQQQQQQQLLSLGDSNAEECRALLRRLQELDPDRQGRYRDMLERAS